MLKAGDRIHIHGQADDFVQLVTSLEIHHASVLWAQPGDDVAMQVIGPVHVNDKVYRIAEKRLVS
jgi:translation elongation factor EF-1alpha